MWPMTPPSSYPTLRVFRFSAVKMTAWRLDVAVAPSSFPAQCTSACNGNGQIGSLPGQFHWHSAETQRGCRLLPRTWIRQILEQSIALGNELGVLRLKALQEQPRCPHVVAALI